MDDIYLGYNTAHGTLLANIPFVGQAVQFYTWHQDLGKKTNDALKTKATREKMQQLKRLAFEFVLLVFATSLFLVWCLT